MPYKDKEKEKEYRKEYRKKNAEKFKRYREENKEHLKEYLKKWSKNNVTKRRASRKRFYQSLNGRFYNAKTGAKRRNILFEISIEKFEEMLKLPCYYCNNDMNFKSTTGSNLDRIDNNIGYIESNIISCCWNCNKIKGNVLTFEEAKIAINAVIAYRKSKITCDE